MQGPHAPVTLTVYHDGRFWVGLFENVTKGRLSVCRMVFGAEPSNEEILRLVTRAWHKLHFSGTTVETETPHMAGNPKRRQCEAAKELTRNGTSTKARQSLSEQLEASKATHKASAKARREAERQERFEKKAQKRKRRHRGH